MDFILFHQPTDIDDTITLSTLCLLGGLRGDVDLELGSGLEACLF
jgi:hypothetical protein